jgi:hypothetical protein
LDALSSLIARIPNTKQAGNAPTSNATPTPSSAPTGSIVIPGTNLFLELWQLGILFLALLFLLVALIIHPSVQRHRAIKAEIDNADRRAAIVAKQIEEMEAAQRNWIEHNQHDSNQLLVSLQQQGSQEKRMTRKTVTNLGCPRCGEPVVYDAIYCRNCGELLSPSESGRHLRIQPTESTVPANPLTNASTRPGLPSASKVPTDADPDQPTLPPLPTSIAQKKPRAQFDTIDIRAGINDRRLIE